MEALSIVCWLELPCFVSLSGTALAALAKGVVDALSKAEGAKGSLLAWAETLC